MCSSVRPANAIPFNHNFSLQFLCIPYASRASNNTNSRVSLYFVCSRAAHQIKQNQLSDLFWVHCWTLCPNAGCVDSTDSPFQVLMSLPAIQITLKGNNLLCQYIDEGLLHEGIIASLLGGCSSQRTCTEFCVNDCNGFVYFSLLTA